MTSDASAQRLASPQLLAQQGMGHVGQGPGQFDSEVMSAFNADEFHRRWARARVASFREAGIQNVAVEAELSLLVSVSQDDRSLVLKSVYDNSRKLGQSAKRFWRRIWGAEMLADLMQSGTIACLSGVWSAPKIQERVLTRKGCSLECSLDRQAKAFVCDYWREALDGLTIGLGVQPTGEGIRFSRYQSMGHGDRECIDVIFHSSDRAKRWGPIPEGMEIDLLRIKTRYESRNIQVDFFGLNEGVLYYEMSSRDLMLCGAGGKIFEDMLKRELKESFSALEFQDASPRAVFGRPE